MRKVLVVGIIVMFLGLSIQPSIGTEIPERIEVEPKDYMFQTIIDIANNPEIKDLLEQTKYELIQINNNRDIYPKILFKNPRLFRYLIVTKSRLTY